MVRAGVKDRLIMLLKKANFEMGLELTKKKS